ncbi:sugar ABC transporter ATP-binding protein [Streptomyces sp. NPDC005820]|uniref:sugar ABC transporter ATP-binding protein n=1 Tax=Streptomyces sp. NPDC005820 TaxID=3157069 RepID=UPI0034005759
MNAQSPNSALVVRGINKWFGDTQVLSDLSFEIGRGKVVALLGENGSGKSTIIKILSGYYQAAPGGVIEAGGHELSSPVTPARAHAAGLRFVHQDLGLVESMSVGDNVCFATGYGSLRAGAIRRKNVSARVRERLGRLGLTWDPNTLLSSLSPAQRTMVAIARVLGDPGEGTPRVLVLDEPTAALPKEEVGLVFDAIERVTSDGGAVLYVSHRIDEVLEVADEVIVLRDGRIVAQRETAGLTHGEIVSLLLGRELAKSAPRRTDSETAAIESQTSHILRLRGLTGRIVRNLDLDVRAGEILGIGGLAGCGRSDLVRLIAGAQGATAGQMTLARATYRPKDPREAIRSGVSYVPEDRRNHGCIGSLPVQHNLTLPDLRSFGTAWWLDKHKERDQADELIARLDVRPRDSMRPIGKLSGGNQQKAVIAKALRVNPRILILDEPTQGIDIGAKAEIASLVLALARDGMTVILASSDGSELAALCDRLVILDRGQIRRVLERPHITEDEIAMATTGATSGVAAT